MKAAWERHVLSLPGPLFMADAPSHLHTSPLLSVTLRCPGPSWSPGLEEKHPRAQPKSDDTGSPGRPMGPGGSRV